MRRLRIVLLVVVSIVGAAISLHGVAQSPPCNMKYTQWHGCEGTSTNSCYSCSSSPSDCSSMPPGVTYNPAGIQYFRMIESGGTSEWVSSTDLPCATYTPCMAIGPKYDHECSLSEALCQPSQYVQSICYECRGNYNNQTTSMYAEPLLAPCQGSGTGQ